MRAENQILNDCLVGLSQAGCVVFRNNTGVLKDANGRPVKFGLCVGSSDIIGLAPGGIFVAIECKTAVGQPTTKQNHFIDFVISKGGRAGVARNSEEAVAIALDLPLPPPS